MRSDTSQPPVTSRPQASRWARRVAPIRPGVRRSVSRTRADDRLASKLSGPTPAAFNRGAVHFSRGIYDLGLPEFTGGDRAKSAELMKRAEAVGPHSILVRRGRAWYYHIETKDREEFERDLRPVLGQDPRQSVKPHAWNVCFQRDATEMLESEEGLF